MFISELRWFSGLQNLELALHYSICLAGAEPFVTVTNHSSCGCRYCVEFQLTSLTAGCLRSSQPHTQWMQYLREGHRVCVECQPPALAAGHQHCSGDGEDDEEDR